jgi:hypothetical protein
MLRLFLLLTFLSFIADPAFAQDSGPCEGYPDVPVTIDATFEEPHYDFSQNLAAIQVIAQDHEHAIPHNEAVSMGITRYRPILEVRISMMVETPPQGKACARVHQVNVKIGYQDVTVFVANEIPRNSCAFNETLGHEEKHVAVNRELLDQFTPLIKQRLEAYLRLYAVFPVDTAAEAEPLLHDHLEGVLEEMIQQMANVNMERQQQVDSPVEYKRLADVCDGALPRIAGAYRHNGR